MCSFGITRDAAQAYTVDGTTGFQINIAVTNPTANAATTTCSIVVGYDGITASQQTAATKSVNVGASSTGLLQFAPTDLPIKSAFSHAVVNCLVPGGGRVRWIDVSQPKNF